MFPLFWITFLVRFLQKCRTNRMYRNIERYLFHVIGLCVYGDWQAPKLQCRPAGWRPTGINSADKVQGVCLRMTSSLGRQPVLVFSGHQLIGWGKRTLWRAICSKFAGLNMHLIQKTPPIWHIKLSITNILRYFLFLRNVRKIWSQGKVISKESYFFILRKSWFLR